MSAPDAANRFVGTWRLVSVTGGPLQQYRGEKPTGLIHYDNSGHMAVQIMPDRPRRTYSDPVIPTAAEARDALLGYTAYFGTYVVDEKERTVTHMREGNINPGALGRFVRRYEFLSKDKLVLRPIEIDAGLVWERIDLG